MDGRLAQAEGLLELDRAEQSLALAGRLLAEEPDSHDAGVVVVRSLLRLRRYGEARHASRLLLARHPDSEQAWRLDALAAARSGDYVGGRRSSRRAVELEPDEWRTHHVAAEVDLVANGPYVEAWNHAVQAVRLAPDEPAAHVLMGNVALRLGRLDTAQDAFTEALRLDPQYDLARHNLGVVALHKGDDAKAAGELASVLEADPTDETTLANLDVVVRRAFGQVYLWLSFVVLGSWILEELRPGTQIARIAAPAGAVIALGAAAIHLGRITHRAGPTFRRYLRSVPRRLPMFGPRLGLLAVAECALVWVGLGPARTDSVAYLVALVALLCAVERARWKHVR